ncbi:MAG TPA: COX15/CtaA family protein [Steroidobacteraceae bacterium]|nr:COX15/CtaA family protein [Steroidobacteraceae bacterium]HRX88299.1 COX15/CtaA family protein [Steroidobacteraceae bacterium]
MQHAHWIRRLALFGIVLCFAVVVFGAYTRLSDAGLGCPDWPGCYGHVTPAGAAKNADHVESLWPGWTFESRKAWIEMIHRYAATTLGFVIVLITALAVVARRQRIVSVPFVTVLLATVVMQGVLGMLTVTWLLKPLIVTAHLIGGLTTLGLLVWLWLTMRIRTRTVGNLSTSGDSSLPIGVGLRRARGLALLAFLALGVQILLGGWTSTNYAAMACPDLPKCQNAWLPEADYSDAFVLWRGLDINYAGGVLDHPARVAIHLTHRLGAIVATLLLCLAAWAAIRLGAGSARNAALFVLAALFVQITIATAMVLKAFPLTLAAAHNAGAALLLIGMVALTRALRPVGAR